MTIPLDQVDCRRETDPTAAARRLASELVTEDFDLTEGPLVRCTLFRVGERTHLLDWSSTTSCPTTGRWGSCWTTSAACTPTNSACRSNWRPWTCTTPTSPSGSGPLWTARRRGARWSTGASASTAPRTHSTCPPTGPGRRSCGSQGQFHHVRFGADLVAGLRDLARRHDTTLLGAFLAGYVALLSRLVRTESLVVGVPVAGRPQAETQRMIGYFLNWLPIHVRVGDRPDLHTLVRRTGSALADAMLTRTSRSTCWSASCSRPAGRRDAASSRPRSRCATARRPRPGCPAWRSTSSSSRAARPTTT